MPTKHSMPSFLVNKVKPELYERWLKRKAMAHVVRDRKRDRTCSVALYKEAIHAAVLNSKGKDAYTGELLHWNLISTYNNEESKKGRHGYKAGFALLPTVDHVSAEATEASFRICGWRTNDAKNDLSLEAFIELCQRVLKHAGYHVKKRG
ncbi:MAG: hypothetical protein LC785_18480 [Acidobacteria bacterium]|nr:hypothetical protein [Acidobacteriota bacterium]MCA1643872.1 hypothetical protein [Acidobacteriota bacterium]